MHNPHFSLLALLLIFPICLLGQDRFNYDQKGLSPNYLVVEMDGMNQATLFKKTESWAKGAGYKIKSSDAPKSIVLEGQKSEALCTNLRGKTYCNDARFQVEVAFKDNKFKLDARGLEQHGQVNQTGLKDWFPVDLTKAPDEYYTRGGELKKQFTSMPSEIAGLFNTFNSQLQKGLKKEKTEEKDDGW